jgi:hypothetical protein
MYSTVTTIWNQYDNAFKKGQILFIPDLLQNAHETKHKNQFSYNVIQYVHRDFVNKVIDALYI